MVNILKFSCPAAVSPQIAFSASPSHSARMSLIFAVTRNVARATGSSRSTRTWPSWGIAKSGISRDSSCHKFQYVLDCFFSVEQLKFDKNHSPICIRFEHGSTTSLPPGIGEVIWQPHLHALSTTSSSSFLMAIWSSWPAQAPCKPRDEIVRTGQVSLEANPRHEQQV